MQTTILSTDDRAVSYREALAWACLGTTLLTYVPYFAYIYRLFSQAVQTGAAFPYGSYLALGGVILLQIVLLVATLVGITLRYKPETRDERDAAIDARAYRWAYLVFSALIFTLFFLAESMLASHGSQNGHPGEAPCLVQGLLLAFVVGETVRYGVQVIGYRRGY